MIRKSIAAVLAAILAFSASAQAAGARSANERAGDILQFALPAIAYGLTFHHDDRPGRLQLLRSVLVTSAITHGLKHTINAQRPGGGNLSFPSGHTSSAFQGAGFIHARYGLRPAAPAYFAAAFVGYSRVQARAHNIPDVLAGAALGIGASFLLTPERHRPGDILIAPSVASRSYGVQFFTRW